MENQQQQQRYQQEQMMQQQIQQQALQQQMIIQAGINQRATGSPNTLTTQRTEPERESINELNNNQPTWVSRKLYNPPVKKSMKINKDVTSDPSIRQSE
ncbi:MAG: hypothetical protein ACK53Y_19015, partial [bacterium]